MFRQLHLHVNLCHIKPAPAPALSIPLSQALRPRLLSAKPPGGEGALLSASSSSATVAAVPRPWSGLQSWRESPLNENRTWGYDGPQRSPSAPPSSDSAIGREDPAVDAVSSLAEFGALVLSTPYPLVKARVSHHALGRWLRHELPIGEFRPPDRPARPRKPALVTFFPLGNFVEQLGDMCSLGRMMALFGGIRLIQVSMRDVPAPKNSGLPLNAYMLHNLAHVELNAIDLAWDTVVRFSPLRDVLGEQFFSDFAHVADEESRHFSWCSQRLSELGFSYGDMPAHDLLWNECEKSSQDVAARLAVIPLVQEARGLDAGPRLVQKLMGFGDHRSAQIVAKIAEEEVAHVAVGVFWFLAVCKRMGRTPCATFKGLLKEFNMEPKGPFNYFARDEAGIPREWYDVTSTCSSTTDLSQVHDRLSHIIAMEKENSSLED